MGILSSSAGLEASYHDRSTQPGWSWARDVVSIGNSGAATSSADHPDITCTNGGTGLYALTYPPCAEADIHVQITSSGGTVTQWCLTALAPTSGTASIQLYGPTGSAANPASGNVLTITYRLRHKE